MDPATTRLTLIRHAAYVPLDEEQPDDPRLSPVGIAQARRLATRLTQTRDLSADVLISSTLRRARETAEIIAPALSLPIIFDKELIEWQNVEGTGLTMQQWFAGLMALPPDQRPHYTPTPGGETWAKFAFRACLALNRITQQHANKSIALVCHGGIIEASFLFALGLSPLEPFPLMMNLGPDFTSITCWRRVTPRSIYRWRLESYNSSWHLRYRMVADPVGDER
jgi:probable phosphoglycerate mutase